MSDQDALPVPVDARQAFHAVVTRVLSDLAAAGSPLDEAAARLVRTHLDAPTLDVVAIENVLSERVLFEASFDSQGYASLTRGAAEARLLERGWRTFLIRVRNPFQLFHPLRVLVNPVAGFEQPVPGEFTPPSGLAQIPWNMDRDDRTGLVEDAWLRAELAPSQALSGLPTDYVLLHLYSSAARSRWARLGVSGVADGIGLHDGSQLVGFDFSIDASEPVTFTIKDDDGRTCFASLIIRDAQGRVYPPQVMRVAPDMRFHPQIYRADGETVRLPAGQYEVEASRGPEYVPVRQTFVAGPGNTLVDIRLRRWAAPDTRGWYSSDPHIHAAGCSHYLSPTEGVGPETMIRQVRGEGLALGQILTWGPGYYHQKQFFSGEPISPPATLEHPDLQVANNQAFETAETDLDAASVLRYDVEVSGFPSSHLGHVMLLNLTDQDYPGTSRIEQWPSYTLPITSWGRRQPGALVGYAHCGFGMSVESETLPNYDTPRFDSIGMNEAIVDVTFGNVDFLAGAEALPAMELNGWYHLLNCGFRLAMIGETDYPCIFDERPGVGRTYVRQATPMRDNGGYQAWVEGVRAGRLYFGDGRAHLLSFTVDSASTGETIATNGPIEVKVRATVTARLEPISTPETESIRARPAWARPAWHLERARIGSTRTVALELVVNGMPLRSVPFEADGQLHELDLGTIGITESSWIALRVLPSAHSHPVFVEVGGLPVRASRRSAEWCRDAVDALWAEKERFVRPAERDDARFAFDSARETYSEIVASFRNVTTDGADRD